MSTTASTTFKVTGMHCSSCSMLITMNLEELHGVETVTCDHASGATQVTFDPALVNTESILDAVVQAGYQAELLG